MCGDILDAFGVRDEIGAVLVAHRIGDAFCVARIVQQTLELWHVDGASEVVDCRQVLLVVMSESLGCRAAESVDELIADITGLLAGQLEC